MNKYSGPDGTDVRTLKFSADQFSGVLLNLFRTSIDQQFVPFLEKMSTVIPVTKRSVPNNLMISSPVAWLTSLEKDRSKRL